MEEAIINWVYLPVTGQLVEDARLPGVENAYAPGSLCSKCYDELYELLETRFDPDNDEDDRVLTDILNDMSTIQKELAFRMFRLGMRFGLDSRKA